jgi:hypothetical protein
MLTGLAMKLLAPAPVKPFDDQEYWELEEDEGNGEGGDEMPLWAL